MDSIPKIYRLVKMDDYIKLFRMRVSTAVYYGSIFCFWFLCAPQRSPSSWNGGFDREKYNDHLSECLNYVTTTTIYNKFRELHDAFGDNRT